MKMFILVFRSSLESEILCFLHEQKVSTFTVIPNVLGRGISGKALGTLDFGGTNSLILIALEEEKARQLESAFRAVHEEWGQQQHGRHIPFHLFAINCEKIV